MEQKKKQDSQPSLLEQAYETTVDRSRLKIAVKRDKADEYPYLKVFKVGDYNYQVVSVLKAGLNVDIELVRINN